ncbi:hypothetical protein J7S33_27890, partial [Saccharothrix algeriensis]
PGGQPPGPVPVDPVQPRAVDVPGAGAAPGVRRLRHVLRGHRHPRVRRVGVPAPAAARRQADPGPAHLGDADRLPRAAEAAPPGPQQRPSGRLRPGGQAAGPLARRVARRPAAADRRAARGRADRAHRRRTGRPRRRHGGAHRRGHQAAPQPARRDRGLAGRAVRHLRATARLAGQQGLRAAVGPVADVDRAGAGTRRPRRGAGRRRLRDGVRGVPARVRLPEPEPRGGQAQPGGAAAPAGRPGRPAGGDGLRTGVHRRGADRAARADAGGGAFPAARPEGPGPVRQGLRAGRPRVPAARGQRAPHHPRTAGRRAAGGARTGPAAGRAGAVRGSATSSLFVDPALACAALTGREKRQAEVLRAKGERAWVLAHPGPPVLGGEPPPRVDAAPWHTRTVTNAFLWANSRQFGDPTGGGDGDGDTLTGVAASRGTYTGPARIVLDEKDFGRLLPGDVLVCSVTSPVWSVLFPVIGALVTDKGGLLSHPAIIAREHGIPAVVSTGQGTELLKDGQIVTVDGAAGAVHLGSTRTPVER